MKKIMISIFTFFIISFFQVACDKDTPEDPTSELIINNGMDSLNLNHGDSYDLLAKTIPPGNSPSYSWGTSDADIVTITVNPYNNAIATISANGIDGEKATITVTDQSNSLNKSIIVNITEIYGEYTDTRDGKTYITVKIGEQIWMAENLNYSPGGWIYDFDSLNTQIYGRLYQWISACIVCPDSWHLPNDEEWIELIDYLNGQDNAGGALKEASTIYWNAPNTGATNASGFSALPGGYRLAHDGSFDNMGYRATFWSSTEFSELSAWHWSMYYNSKSVGHQSRTKLDALSVRCVRDE